MITEHATADILDVDECRRLLQTRAVRVGRVGFVADDGRPTVLPLNFCWDGDALVLRTGESSLLAAVRGGHPLAFEVDEVDPAWREGWSVLVRDVAEEITDPGELERVQRLPLRPWAPGAKPHWVRLPIVDLSGRRLV